MAQTTRLARRIGPGLLTAYGVGVMVGAGIYVLVGAVAADAGVWAPLSFLLAGLVAAPTALAYAEFSTRLPEAAGEAAYVAHGLRHPSLALLVGLAIVAAGTVSAGAVLRGGAGYFAAILPLPNELLLVALGLALIAVAVWGVLESLALAAVFTAAELAGLGLVVWAGSTAQPVADWSAPPAIWWPGVGAGAALAFFAFIGFEDIVNMAEEVRDPEHTLPRAILWSLAIASALYCAVAWAAVRAVPIDELAASERPLLLVWQSDGARPAAILSGIAVLAALNGVLAQIVMAARVLYGLGQRSPALGFFAIVHPRRKTPVRATLVVGAAVLAAALGLQIAHLAQITTALLLTVFCLVNLALIALKRRAPSAQFRVAGWVPVAGLALSALALAMTLTGGTP